MHDVATQQKGRSIGDTRGQAPDHGRSENGSEALRHNVEASLDEINLSHHHERRRDSRVDVATRDGSNRVGQDDNTDSECEGYGCQEGVIEIGRGVQRLRRDGGATADDDEEAGREELGSEGFAVGGSVFLVKEVRFALSKERLRSTGLLQGCPRGLKSYAALVLIRRPLSSGSSAPPTSTMVTTTYVRHASAELNEILQHDHVFQWDAGGLTKKVNWVSVGHADYEGVYRPARTPTNPGRALPSSRDNQ